MEPFSFATSESLNHPVTIRILNLEGDEVPFLGSTLLAQPELKHIGSNTSTNSDLYVTVQVWAGSKALTVPVQTCYKPFRSDRRWMESLTLPITYRDLPANASLAITMWDVSPTGGRHAQGHAVPFGGTTLPLFDRDNQVQKGRQKCCVYRQQPADGNENTTTPAFADAAKANDKDGSAHHMDKELEEIDRMERLFKQQEMGEIPRVEWLDQLVFRGFEKKTSQVAKASLKKAQFRHTPESSTTENGEKKVYTVDERPGPSKFVLHVELPMFDFPVVFSDHEYPVPPISNFQPMSASQSSIMLKPPPDLQYGPGIGGSTSEHGHGRVIRVYDPELGQRDNPAETKHRRLVRSQHRHGLMDKDLKPNAKVRDELNMILGYSPTHVLAPEEKDLIWKFRYHLTRDKRALTKFVKSVNWDDQTESKQAAQILGRWTSIDVDEALELLGPTFSNAAVRSFAVDRLRKADDDELLLYLLQLVQALKFEHINAESNQEVSHDSSLAQLLIQRAVANFNLGNYFYWYLMVECDDKSPEQAVEYRTVFNKVAYDFMTELEKSEGGSDKRVTLRRQAELICILEKIAQDVKTANLSVAKKVDELKKALSDPDNGLVSIDPPLPFFLDPSVKVTSVSLANGGDETTVFKSSLCPIKVTFKTEEGKKYPIIFKKGDDLRQDQLCIQIITLMDRLLRKENLDLKLSPYKILATSTTAGASQFVDSRSLQSLVSRYKGGSTTTTTTTTTTAAGGSTTTNNVTPNSPALEWLRTNNPDPRSDLGVRKETLDTFVRSCAGYSVITYILGVGDRHLDNLLLSPSGHFFHADFGFILGRDPKPMAPPVKVSKEMVDAMGGMGSEHYRLFKQYCFLAFAALRKSSNLILNLFSLMVDANIPDIRVEPERAVFKVKDRFHLDLSEEDAMRHFERVMEDSLGALGAAVIDAVHDVMQRLRT